ncbi:META domain-containing protein [Paracoccus aestuariivivens]|uniref:META domain-containing protein n=2 Tax=Paracoccus aestuariivivens TaxID=1820333 RepID=A0A6L6J5R0_9RHOB|nr:META domain-containing protein [Paracoccus aestuariivivens]
MRGIAFAVTLGCAGVAAQAETRPVTGDYQLIEVEGKTILNSPTARLEADGSISGQGPCNTYRGANHAELPGLLYKAMISTRRACLVEGGEADFLAALAAVRHAKFVGEDLVMTGPEVTIRWRPVH